SQTTGFIAAGQIAGFAAGIIWCGENYEGNRSHQWTTEITATTTGTMHNAARVATSRQAAPVRTNTGSGIAVAIRANRRSVALSRLSSAKKCVRMISEPAASAITPAEAAAPELRDFVCNPIASV